MRVIVTGGEHVGPLAAVRALRTAGYEPWAAVSERKAYAAHSRAATGVLMLPDSRNDPEGFVEGLVWAAEDLGVGAILCGTERDLIAVARGRERLGPLRVATPELETVLRITSKRTVNQLAARVGLKIPSTIEVDRAGLGGCSELALPLIVKPMRSEEEAAGGGFVHTDVIRVNAEGELRRLASALAGERWIIQSCLEGQLGAICGVAWNGRIVCAVHQVAERIWPTGAGVSAYARTVAADPTLEADVGRLIEALGWSGIFQAQFIHAPDASYLIDLNPRVYGSLALATAAGANLAAIWASLLAGSQADRYSYRIGVCYRAEELDVRALIQLLRRGKPAAASLGLIPHRHTAHAVASLTDPLPALASLAKLYGRRHRRRQGSGRGPEMSLTR